MIQRSFTRPKELSSAVKNQQMPPSMSHIPATPSRMQQFQIILLQLPQLPCRFPFDRLFKEQHHLLHPAYLVVK
ncbi:hypothetical protein LB503_010947 [Fusarium chuoi]|nr:hypothetical protein LB503_010947 [Fusarium chuoi]